MCAWVHVLCVYVCEFVHIRSFASTLDQVAMWLSCPQLQVATGGLDPVPQPLLSTGASVLTHGAIQNLGAGGHLPQRQKVGRETSGGKPEHTLNGEHAQLAQLVSCL